MTIARASADDWHAPWGRYEPRRANTMPIRSRRPRPIWTSRFRSAPNVAPRPRNPSPNMPPDTMGPAGDPQAASTYPSAEEYGGEAGIRTRAAPYGTDSLNRRAPSSTP